MSLCGTEETTRELNNQTTLKQKQDSTGDSGATVRETSHNVQPTASSFPVDPTSAPGKTEQYQNTRPWETKTSQDHDDHQVPVSVPLVPHVRSSLSGVGSALSGESSFSATPPSCLESSSSDLPRFPTAPPLSSPSCQYHTTSPAECRPLEPLSLSGPTGYPPSSALSKAAGTPRPCMKRRIVKYLPNFLTYFRLGASVILFLSLFYPNLIFSRCGFEADVAASTAESSQRLWFRSSLSSKEATHPLQFSLSLLGTASPLSPCSPSLSSFTLHDTSPGSSKAASPSEEQSCFFPLVPSPPHHVAPSPLFSAGLFVLASVTDFLDGYLARKFNVCSPVGALLDALTDKLLVSAALGGICSLAVPPFSRVLGPPATIIFMREIAVQGLRLHLEKMNRGSEGEVQWLGKVKTALQMVSVSFLLLLLPLYTRSPQSMPAPLFLPPVSSVMTQLSSSLWGRSSVSEAVNGSTGKAGPGEQFWTRTRRKDFGSSWEPQSGSATYVVCSRLKGRKYSPSSSRPHDLDQLSLPLTGSLSLSTGTEAEEAPAEKQEMDAVCAPFFGVGRSSTRVGTKAHTLKKALPAAATAMLRYGWKPTGLGSEACALVYGRFSASVRTLREKLRSGGLRLWQERIAIKGRNLVSLEGCRLPRPCARSLLGKTSSILRNRAMALGKSRAAHWCGSISLGIKASLRCTLSADGLPTALTYSVLGLWGAAFLAVISGGLYFRRATSGKKKETA
ncbi:cdp-alcohol phosphatidyltransferase superfamily protein [Cystoisospora suis]|uniref:Cdp-alcohol phosphatidyltransferase superfamily protein n=1 Tax=Cystoisospora suis TaxID=483139 RepID=A0A2C6L906_9APIC|nr:cdp-alcohol phosphatidyltransferase superfamily protein [Cystoisospora suis]